MAKVAQEQLAGGSTETHFYQAKIKTAHFFMSKLLPQTESLLTEIEAGKESLMALDVAEF